MVPNPRKPNSTPDCEFCVVIRVMIPLMTHKLLVTRRVYPEAIEFLQQHGEVDYNSTDDILSPAALIERARGKHAIVSQLVDKFTRDVIAELDPSEV